MTPALAALVRELRSRLAKGTPRPWTIAPGNFVVADCDHNDPTTGRIVAEVPCQGANDDDLPLIVAAVNALPALLDALEAGEREVTKLRESINSGRVHGGICSGPGCSVYGCKNHFVIGKVGR